MSGLTKLKEIWPWLALFLISFTLFLGAFWLDAGLRSQFAALLRIAGEKDIETRSPILSCFPPAASAELVALPLGDGRLTLTDLAAKLEFFPPAARFSARVLGGRLDALARISLGSRPSVSRVDFSLTGVDLINLNDLAPASSFVDIRGGSLDAGGYMDLAYADGKPDWPKCAGALDLSVADAAVGLKIPLLRDNDLNAIRGDASLIVSGETLELRSCRLAAPPLAFDADGEVESWPHPALASVDMATELRVPADAVNAALIPPRTMERVSRGGLVRARIEGPLTRPGIYLEN